MVASKSFPFATQALKWLYAQGSSGDMHYLDLDFRLQNKNATYQIHKFAMPWNHSLDQTKHVTVTHKYNYTAFILKTSFLF